MPPADRNPDVLSGSRAGTQPGVFLHAAASTGKRLRRIMATTGSMAWLSLRTLSALLSLRTDQFSMVYSITRMQVRFTALDALPLVLFTALLMGGVTLLQVFGQMSSYGAENFLSRLMAKLVLRELGPLFVGIIVIGRSGTAIAAEMASMKLGGEVDALCAMGVNPFQFLLLPRVVGGVISLFTLIICFDATAILGGFFVAWLSLPLSLRFYLNALGGTIGAPELALTACKAIAFGGLIPLVCVASGLQVRRSTTEIPQAVTRAAVIALITLFLVGGLLSVAFYA